MSFKKRGIISKSILYFIVSIIILIFLYLIILTNRTNQLNNPNPNPQHQQYQLSDNMNRSFFSKIYIINRLKRIDRLRSIQKVFDNTMVMSPIKYNGIGVPSHKITDISIITAIDKDSNWAVNERSKKIRKVNVGEIATYASHIQTLHTIVKEQSAFRYTDLI